MKTFPLTLVLLFILRLRFPLGSSVRRILTSRYGQTALSRFEIHSHKMVTEYPSSVRSCNISIPDYFLMTSLIVLLVFKVVRIKITFFIERFVPEGAEAV